MDVRAVATSQPTVWILAFCPRASGVWTHRLIPGRYKHVRAYAFVPALKTWLFYDVTLANTLVLALPDGELAEKYILDFTRDCDLMSVRTRPRRGVRLSPFTCVSAVKHLIGLSSSALRPDRLYRDCLAAGGTLLAPQRPSTAAAGIRSTTA